MKKLNLITILIIFTILTSCEDKENNNDITLNNNLILSQKIELSNDNKVVYIYTDNKILIEKNKSFTNKYEYKDNLITKIKNNFSETTYFYNENKELKTEIYISKDYKYESNYFYDNDNITIVKKKFDLLKKREDIIIINYLMVNGNIRRMTEEYNEVKTDITYTYDNKHNPYTNIKGIDKLLIPYLSQKNNVLREDIIKTKNKELMKNTYINAITYEYMYNPNNFPVYCKKITFEGKGEEKDLSKTRYIYKKE